MYTPGRLIYFNPFYFNEGGYKPKYFLVIKVVGENAIIASLPSSKIHLPATLKISHGCLEVPDSGVNCYIIEANRKITKCGWSFELDTFLYGPWLDEYDLNQLAKNYSIPDVDYQIVGELLEEELQKIIDCFRTSSSVKRKFKKILSL